MFRICISKMSFLQELWNFMKKSTKSKHDRLNSKAMDRNKKVERWDEGHPITSADYTQYRWRTVNKGKKFKLSKKDGQKKEQDNATGHQCEGGCSCQLVKEFTRAKERGDIEAMERIKEGKFIPENHYDTEKDIAKLNTTADINKYETQKDSTEKDTTTKLDHCDKNQDTTYQNATAEIRHDGTKRNSAKRDTLAELNPIDNTKSNKAEENAEQNEIDKEIKDSLQIKSKKSKRKGKKKSRMPTEDTTNHIQDTSQTKLSDVKDQNGFEGDAINPIKKDQKWIDKSEGADRANIQNVFPAEHETNVTTHAFIEEKPHYYEENENIINQLAFERETVKREKSLRRSLMRKISKIQRSSMEAQMRRKQYLSLGSDEGSGCEEGYGKIG